MTSALAAIADQQIDLGSLGKRRWFSLPAIEAHGAGPVSRLPVSLRIVLESVVRHADGERIGDRQIRELANWQPKGARDSDIAFTVGRVVLNCAAGIPLLGDLTAIRGAVARLGLPAGVVNPAVPVDMALDHTLTVDFHGTADAMARNMALDIRRNRERYEFVKWAVGTYDRIRLFPPGAGILHQLNLEFLAPGLGDRDGVCFPDTLVGTDSHTCMISGLGALGWGVGGIEAQAALLGEPVYFLMPDVVGVHVTGVLRAGVTATDLVLHVTEMLRRFGVVGKFVEFFGEGVENLTVPDRATIANMATEYGATIGYFPVDEQTCRYLSNTGRSDACARAVETYFRAQRCFGAPRPGQVDYTDVIDLDLCAVAPTLAGPRRPQDRVMLPDLKRSLAAMAGSGTSMRDSGAASNDAPLRVRDGDVVIAAITSCTNTSNPGVMITAGLLARKARERGLTSKPWVKTSLTPGSVVVSRYLETLGLQRPLDELGFFVAGYSCATCVGASGPLPGDMEAQIEREGVLACAVLSGNRNFEARIHPVVRAAYLASPPLVVAFALAGTVNIDLDHDPLGYAADGSPVFLHDLWPSAEELEEAMTTATDPDFYRAAYAGDPAGGNPLWTEIPRPEGDFYPWDPSSSYLKEPPFLASTFRKSALRDIEGARALAILGDSVTTDHISPIGAIKASSPAGDYLRAEGVQPVDFNNYASRRLNHEVMVRGAFSNVRLSNRMVPGIEGGFTAHQPDGEVMTIYDAAKAYAREAVPLVVVAGREYGTGSARDWAAKGTRLLGVSAVIAGSFERIHRSNLVGMGVLPCQLPEAVTAEALRLDGSEMFDLTGFHDGMRPRQQVRLVIRRASGETESVPLTLRVDTGAEMDYITKGGLMPYILSTLSARARSDNAVEVR